MGSPASMGIRFCRIQLLGLRCNSSCATMGLSGLWTAAGSFATGGKSGLLRAGWWVTPTVRKNRESATENKPPDGLQDLFLMATVRVKR